MMWRIRSYRREWRIGFLLLLLLAVVGPWTFERIHVPAEYQCGGGSIRLDGDFCGVPFSGFRVFNFMLAGLAGMIMLPMSDAPSSEQMARELIFIFLSFLLFLPVVTTLVLVVRGDDGRRRLFHTAALILALCMLIVLGLPGLPGFSAPLYASWGIWLYIVLMLSALLIEALSAMQAIHKRK